MSDDINQDDYKTNWPLILSYIGTFLSGIGLLYLSYTLGGDWISGIPGIILFGWGAFGLVSLVWTGIPLEKKRC